jgi:hypothetical protein
MEARIIVFGPLWRVSTRQAWPQLASVWRVARCEQVSFCGSFGKSTPVLLMNYLILIISLSIPMTFEDTLFQGDKVICSRLLNRGKITTQAFQIFPQASSYFIHLYNKYRLNFYYMPSPVARYTEINKQRCMKCTLVAKMDQTKVGGWMCCCQEQNTP